MDIVVIIIVLIGLYLGYISTTGTKSQNIRLTDIFIIGPLMIYFGAINYKNIESNNLFKYATILLIFFGATTITYNLKNYLNHKNQLE